MFCGGGGWGRRGLVARRGWPTFSTTTAPAWPLTLPRAGVGQVLNGAAPPGCARNFSGCARNFPERAALAPPPAPMPPLPAAAGLAVNIAPRVVGPITAK